MALSGSFSYEVRMLQKIVLLNACQLLQINKPVSLLAWRDSDRL